MAALRIEKRRAELWGLDQFRTHHVQVEPPAFDTRPGDMLAGERKDPAEAGPGLRVGGGYFTM